MNAFGPLDPEADTALTAVCFAEDPVLGMLETPNGLLRFLQLVGISADERALILDWDAASFMDVLTEQDPMLVTDLGARACSTIRRPPSSFVHAPTPRAPAFRAPSWMP